MDLKEKLKFPTSNEEKHYPERLKTEDDVEEKETTGTEASGSPESGSPGPLSEQSGLYRRVPTPTYQSSVLNLPQQSSRIGQHDIPPLSELQSPSPPYSKVVSEYKPKPTPQCAPSTASPPAPIDAEMTSHRDALVTGSSLLPERSFINIELEVFSEVCKFVSSPIDESTGSDHPSEDPLYSSSEEVDATNADQTLLYRLEPYVLTPNERDQKYLEGRDYNVLRDDVQVFFSVIKDVNTGALAVRKESKSERECEMLSKVNGTHVILILGAVIEKATVKLFQEHAPCGTIRSQFRNNKCFQRNPALISHILEQVFQGLNCLHQNGILHRDIKGDNVAVCSSNWLCKLTNLDEAIYVKDVSKERTSKGPSCYSSPELIADPKWSYSSDMWSAMLLFVEMMTGENPWHSSIERDVQYERFLQDAIFSKMYYVTKKISSYSEQIDYPKLVDEPLYQQRLQAEFGSTPEHARQLAIFDQLAALAKEVFVRDATRRPSAHVLLNSRVMIEAYFHYFTVPKPLTDH